MKPSTITALSAVILTAAAAYVSASDDDSRNRAGREDWLPQQQIEAQLNEMGYQVDRLKVDDGCLKLMSPTARGCAPRLMSIRRPACPAVGVNILTATIDKRHNQEAEKG
ncbi:MAG: PepSY domain-containing protein [Gammaproteobacteria bacterium]|nr:PepSY domain-containing protein [Gammaproteobacteria bacterium]